MMLAASQSDQEVKDALKFGTSLLFLLCKQQETQATASKNLRQWVRTTNLIEFVKEMLNFCMKRLDTFAELLKEQAAKLLCIYTNEADDGQICAELCKDQGLLELLGDYLNDSQ